MSGPDNPDFSLSSKRKIATATRMVLGAPQNNGNVMRPFVVRDAIVSFATQTNVYSPSNGATVTLTPCKSYADASPANGTSTANIEAIINLAWAASGTAVTGLVPPVIFGGLQGNVLAYEDLGIRSGTNTLYVLRNPPMIPNTTNSADVLFNAATDGITANYKPGVLPFSSH